MADSENVCPNSQHHRSQGKHPSLPIAPSGKINTRYGGKDVSFGPNVAELTALFSKPSKPSSHMNDLSGRQKRRMEMLQERRLQQVLKQRSMGSGTSSSLTNKPGVANLSMHAKTSISLGRQKGNDKNDSILNRDMDFFGRQEAGNADRVECLKLAPDAIQMDITSIPVDECTTLCTVDKIARIMTLTLRLIMLGLALYEVQLHCAATSTFIRSNLQALSIYFRHITYHASITLEASRKLCLQLIPLQCWCWEMWFHVTWKVFVEKYHHVIRIINAYADRVFDQLSWDNGLHLLFVTTLLIRCVLNLMAMASRRWYTSDASGSKRNIFSISVAFLAGLSCWLVLLPLFDECEITTTRLGKYCFFIRTNAPTRLKDDVAKIAKVSNPRYSLFDVMAFRFYKNSTIFATSKVRSQIRKELHGAVMSPFKFHGRLRKLLMIPKWAKFLAPLIGTCNKLRGHILDMIRKKHQHVKSKAAQKRWREVMLALSKQSKLERAVLQLQKSFREKRQHTAKRRYELLSSNRCSRMSKRIRRTLLEEHAQARSKLEKIEEINHQRQVRRQVSQDERTNISKHKQLTRKKNKRLLLSPKTSFAVVWKCVAIICVVLEISQIIFAPMLSGEMTKMPLDKFLSKVLLATGCEEKVKKAVAPSIVVPFMNEFTANLCTTSSINQTWLAVVRVIATILVPTVNAIFFLDVFITFFTGELTPSGSLVPKPFFARFILPGIGLQLIVNPTMIAFSKLTKRAIELAIEIGPSLSMHVILAFAPFTVLLYDNILDLVFDFVEKQNKIISRRSIFD